MKIDLKNIIEGLDSSINFDEEINLDQDLVDKNIVLPIRLKGTIYADSDGGYLTGKVIFSYKDSCARCLKETITEITADIDASLVKEGVSSLDEEDDSQVEFTDKEIFIEDLISSVILTSSPMRVICSDDCKGICPVCGANLNDEQCNCEIDNVDPRLAKLKDFFN